MRSTRWVLRVLVGYVLGFAAVPASATAAPHLDGYYALDCVGDCGLEESIKIDQRSPHHARMTYLLDGEGGVWTKWADIALRDRRWSGALPYRLGRSRSVMHWSFRVTTTVGRLGKRYVKRITGRMHEVFNDGRNKRSYRFKGENSRIPEGRKPPYANWWYEPANPSVSAGTNALNFLDHSFDRGPTSDGIVAYAWDFGDPASGAANNSVLPSPTHTFAAPGDYPVTMTVTDDDGMTDSATYVVTIAP